MKLSKDRILTTHVGSLPRSEKVFKLGFAKEDGNNLVVVDSYESFQDPGRPIPRDFLLTMASVPSQTHNVTALRATTQDPPEIFSTRGTSGERRTLPTPLCRDRKKPPAPGPLPNETHPCGLDPTLEEPDELTCETYAPTIACP